MYNQAVSIHIVYYTNNYILHFYPICILSFIRIYADDDADIPAPTAEEVFADEALEDPDLYLTEEEQAELRQNHWRLLSGFGDFISIIAGCAVILVLITMLVSLLNWLHSDILQSISLFQTMI